MYAEYWGLKEKPFENTPDPRFLFLSPKHEEALLRLKYAVTEGKGCAMLTGVFGCGKTLLAQTLLNQLEEGVYKIAMVNNPVMSNMELLRAIATRLGAIDLPTKRTELLKDVLLDVIGSILVNNRDDGKKSVIIIDELHAIKESAIFEELRLLLNFQLQDQFLLTLLLLGQPELTKFVELNKQLNQRIAIRYHLDSLTKDEMRQYVSHRLKVAGQEGAIFTEDAFDVIFEKSGGIPRRVNQLCDMCLLIGMEKKLSEINGELVREAAKVLEG